MQRCTDLHKPEDNFVDSADNVKIGFHSWTQDRYAIRIPINKQFAFSSGTNPVGDTLTMNVI